MRLVYVLNMSSSLNKDIIIIIIIIRKIIENSSAVTYLPLEISFLYFVQSSELDKVVFHSYFLTENM